MPRQPAGAPARWPLLLRAQPRRSCTFFACKRKAPLSERIATAQTERDRDRERESSYSTLLGRFSEATMNVGYCWSKESPSLCHAKPTQRDTKNQRGREAERQRDKKRQTDRQTDRQTNRQTDRQTKTDRQTDRQTDRDRERQCKRTLSRAHVAQVDAPAHTVSALVSAGRVQREVVKRHHIANDHRLGRHLPELLHAAPRRGRMGACARERERGRGSVCVCVCPRARAVLTRATHAPAWPRFGRVAPASRSCADIIAVPSEDCDSVRGQCAPMRPHRSRAASPACETP